MTVRFPQSIISASFQPVPGWERSIEMEPLDEPIEDEGEQITEHIASVTWTGGRIRPGEFEEFGVSFRVPETPGEDLVVPALQTYSNGEVVRWVEAARLRGARPDRDGHRAGRRRGRPADGEPHADRCVRRG